MPGTDVGLGLVAVGTRGLGFQYFYKRQPFVSGTRFAWPFFSQIFKRLIEKVAKFRTFSWGWRQNWKTTQVEHMSSPPGWRRMAWRFWKVHMRTASPKPLGLKHGRHSICQYIQDSKVAGSHHSKKNLGETHMEALENCGGITSVGVICQFSKTPSNLDAEIKHLLIHRRKMMHRRLCSSLERTVWNWWIHELFTAFSGFHSVSVSLFQKKSSWTKKPLKVWNCWKITCWALSSS